MKAIFTHLSFVLLFVSLCSITNDHGNFDARLNTYKQECKQAIKPARYEGSRITYYLGSSEAQKKVVETFLLLDTEYKFAFSGKECTGKVGVRFYDSSDESKRKLLGEIKNIKDKTEVISSNVLSKTFQKFHAGSERLKTLYIEYSIAPGKAKNEAVVLVIGYMD